MFAVIVNEVKKYSPKTRKLKRKAGKLVEQLDVITFLHVRTGGMRVMHGGRFNLQKGIHVKRDLTHVKRRAKHVKLSGELLSLPRKLASLR